MSLWQDLRRPRRIALRCVRLLGFDPIVLFQNVRGAPAFVRDIRSYRKRNIRPGFQLDFPSLDPILKERYESAGTVGGHYFHQDLWAARKIFARRPGGHVDIGSRIDGFIAHLLVFMPVTVVDLRPMDAPVDGLTFIQDDATELSRFDSSVIDSISSLHAAEHFGLGRYGDPVDPDACFRFMDALQRVLKPQGRLYFSVPVGRERVEFNGQRVFAVRTVLESLSALDLVSFSMVNDDGSLTENADPAASALAEYACGLFEFTKR
jgi:hypothetical protein